MSAASEAIKAKIRALLAKTVANGCTEAEPLADAAMAMRMMQEHGITEAELDIVTGEVAPGKVAATASGRAVAHVAYVCRCRLLLLSGEQYILQSIGRDPWPEVAA